MPSLEHKPACTRQEEAERDESIQETGDLWAGLVQYLLLHTFLGVPPLLSPTAAALDRGPSSSIIHPTSSVLPNYPRPPASFFPTSQPSRLPTSTSCLPTRFPTCAPRHRAFRRHDDFAQKARLCLPTAPAAGPAHLCIPLAPNAEPIITRGPILDNSNPRTSFNLIPSLGRAPRIANILFYPDLLLHHTYTSIPAPPSLESSRSIVLECR